MSHRPAQPTMLPSTPLQKTSAVATLLIYLPAVPLIGLAMVDQLLTAWTWPPTSEVIVPIIGLASLAAMLGCCGLAVYVLTVGSLQLSGPGRLSAMTVAALLGLVAALVAVGWLLGGADEALAGSTVPDVATWALIGLALILWGLSLFLFTRSPTPREVEFPEEAR